MKKFVSRAMALTLALAFVLFGAEISLSQETAKESRAILMVAFGSSVEGARVSYQQMEERVRAAFPGVDVRWAWTAHALLSSSEGRFSVQEALAKMAAGGVKRVDILSLHVIPGKEYDYLTETAHALAGLPKGIEEIRVARPLLHDAASVRAVAGILLQSAPKERASGDALLFVGHGTHHGANVYYPALQYYLHALDPRAYVGTVEDPLDLDTMVAALQADGVRTVWLAPLMTVAGDHAVNDLFGDDVDSWRRTLAAHGMQVEIVRKGLGEYPLLQEEWVRGLKETAAE